jgi:hypothetical protein
MSKQIRKAVIDGSVTMLTMVYRPYNPAAPVSTPIVGPGEFHEHRTLLRRARRGQAATLEVFINQLTERLARFLHQMVVCAEAGYVRS